MTPDVLTSKAVTAISSARLLLDHGDVDGACNRAYYAMFDAAKAALMSLAPGGDSALTKTHGGLISAFGLNLVKSWPTADRPGKVPEPRHEVRQIADYTGDEVSAEHSRALVEEAEMFVNCIGTYLRTALSGGNQPI